MDADYIGSKNSFTGIGAEFSCFHSIALKLSTKCNLNCEFCCEPFNSKYEADFSVWKRIIEKLVPLGPKKFCLTGGEPTLNKDLGEIIRFINSKNIQPLLSTNGTTLKGDEDFLRLVSGVRVSLHGLEKTHDKIVGKTGSFLKTVSFVKTLVENKIPVFAAFVPTKENISELADVAKLCRYLGIIKFYVFTILKSGKGAKMIKGNKIVPLGELEAIIEEIKAVAKQEAWDMEIKIFKYANEGECIICYADGDLFAEPYHSSATNKLMLGNVLTDAPSKLIEDFPFKESYITHLKKC